MSKLTENPRSAPALCSGFVESSANRDEDRTYAGDETPDGGIPLHGPNNLVVPNDTTAPQERASELKLRIESAQRFASAFILSTVMVALEALRRGVVNHPRATLATVLSVLVLSGVAVTRPSKKTPVAEWSSGQPIVTLAAENPNFIPNEHRSKLDTTAADAGRLSTLESKAPSVSITTAHPNADFETRMIQPPEAIELPVTEQFVALQATSNEPAFPRTSTVQDVQGDPLASETTPASGGVNMPSVIPPQDLQLSREKHEQLVLDIGGATVPTPVTQTKAEKPSSGLKLNEGAPSLVPQESIKSLRAESDSSNGLTQNTAKSKDFSIKSKPVSERVAAPIALQARASTPPTLRSNTISASSAPAADKPIESVKTDSARNSPELREAKSESSTLGSPNSAAQGKTTEDGRTANSNDIEAAAAELKAVPDPSDLIAAATDRKSSGLMSNLPTVISFESAPTANSTTLPAASVASKAVFANSAKDLSSSASAPHVVLPKDLIESTNELPRRAGEKASAANSGVTNGREQSGTGKLSITQLPISTQKSNRAPSAEGNVLRERGSESVVGQSNAPMKSVPEGSDRPARSVNDSDSVINHFAVQSDSQLSQPSGHLSQSSWVTVPNNEKILENSGSDPESVSPRLESGALPTRDPQAHADKAIDLELDAAQPPMLSHTRNLNHTTSSSTKLSTESGVEHLTSIQGLTFTPHVVQRGENFWTISRQYFATGNYWIALWKCNSEKIPEIDKLHVGDVIMIPPIEDLDLAATDPRLSQDMSNTQSRVSMGNGEFESHGSASARSAGQLSRVGTTSINRLSRSDDKSNRVPQNRASKFDSTNDEIARDRENRHMQDLRVNRRSSSSDSIDNDDGEHDLRSSSRPTTKSSQTGKPLAYKIKRYDTIRSIARDMLGDSSRGQEIIEMNKAIVDDPNHLVVGQFIELPE